MSQDRCVFLFSCSRSILNRAYQINYGGRVTDDWDRRCLMTTLGQYFTDRVLQDAYAFSESGVYLAPPEGYMFHVSGGLSVSNVRTGSFESVLQYLERLPSADPPEIFGMHENANITFQQQETGRRSPFELNSCCHPLKTANILSIVLAIQPRAVAAASGLSNDEVVAQVMLFLLRCFDQADSKYQVAARLTAEVPPFLNKEEARASGRVVNGVLDSLTVVLVI